MWLMFKTFRPKNVELSEKIGDLGGSSKCLTIESTMICASHETVPEKTRLFGFNL